MCIVEIQGRLNTPTACTTLVEDGMIVQTNSPTVQSLRTELLKLLLWRQIVIVVVPATR